MSEKIVRLAVKRFPIFCNCLFVLIQTKIGVA